MGEGGLGSGLDKLDINRWHRLFCFFGRCAACGILAPQPGIEPMPPAVEAWSPNHWTAGEVQVILFGGNRKGQRHLHAWAEGQKQFTNKVMLVPPP